MSKRSPFLRRARLEHHRLAGQCAGVQRAHVRGELRRAHGEVVASDRLGARPAAHLLVRRIDIHDAKVGVAQHERIGHRVEDRTVLLAAPLDLAGGPHRENLQNGLAQRHVTQRLPVHGADQAERRAARVVQRIGGVAVQPELGEEIARWKLLTRPFRQAMEVAPDDERARRAFQHVVEGRAHAAIEMERKHAHLRARRVGEHGDEADRHAQDVGELAREALEHPVPLRVRDRNGSAA